MANNKTMNVAILGDGLLGNELGEQSGWDVISRSANGFDITDPSTWTTHLLENEHGVIFYNKYDVIVNCMAHTDTYSHDKELHWKVNYEGVANLVEFCNRHSIKLVHMSTDYVYSNSTSDATEEDVPVHCANWYGYTKLLGESHVQLRSNNFLVIRATHKKLPFEHIHAWITQVGNFDYVDVIATLIIGLVASDLDGIYNVGTELKTMYDLAKKSNPDVMPTIDVAHDSTPLNTSMSILKMLQALDLKTFKSIGI